MYQIFRKRVEFHVEFLMLLSFTAEATLLEKAITDDDKPTPGYLYQEIGIHLCCISDSNDSCSIFSVPFIM